MVAICDKDICHDSLAILHNFFTADQLKYNVYTETSDIFVKSLELLYKEDNEDRDICKDAFLQYIVQEVVPRTQDTDNALKKFFK